MPEELVLDPALVAGLRAEVNVAELPEFFGRAVQAAATGIPSELVVGPVVAVYHRDDGDRFDVTIGLPVSAAPEGDAFDVVELPGGRALRATHHGEYPALREAYAALDAELAARGRTRSIAWEAYLVGPADDPDPSAWTTTVTIPLGD